MSPAAVIWGTWEQMEEARCRGIDSMHGSRIAIEVDRGNEGPEIPLACAYEDEKYDVLPIPGPHAEIHAVHGHASSVSAAPRASRERGSQGGQACFAILNTGLGASRNEGPGASCTLNPARASRATEVPVMPPRPTPVFLTPCNCRVPHQGEGYEDGGHGVTQIIGATRHDHRRSRNAEMPWTRVRADQERIILAIASPPCRDARGPRSHRAGAYDPPHCVHLERTHREHNSAGATRVRQWAPISLLHPEHWTLRTFTPPPRKRRGTRVLCSDSASAGDVPGKPPVVAPTRSTHVGHSFYAPRICRAPSEPLVFVIGRSAAGGIRPQARVGNSTAPRPNHWGIESIPRGARIDRRNRRGRGSAAGKVGRVEGGQVPLSPFLRALTPQPRQTDSGHAARREASMREHVRSAAEGRGGATQLVLVMRWPKPESDPRLRGRSPVECGAHRRRVPRARPPSQRRRKSVDAYRRGMGERAHKSRCLDLRAGTDKDGKAGGVLGTPPISRATHAPERLRKSQLRRDMHIVLGISPETCTHEGGSVEEQVGASNGRGGAAEKSVNWTKSDGRDGRENAGWNGREASRTVGGGCRR
ncbi:hypothetical protein DFH07DRAFT_773789 [Mycena maculata]|uniref:Uncharacterized protein n=1 Tax=Mycena maculata TaxID=230809 RepID=A0AAD7J2G7_9AGAR|nr:hypothetical protein DFH07DRAFT_773789 [Mycena maculata]